MRLEVKINGAVYPCQPTNGAMLRFKEQTGKEVTEIDARSVSDLLTYLWCCVVSASRREGVDFNMSLMDFADATSPEDLQAWSAAMGAEVAEAEETEAKKKGS